MKSIDRQHLQEKEVKKAQAASNSRLDKLEEKMDGFAETQAKILEILEQNGIDRKTEAEEKKAEKKAEKKSEEKKAEKKAEKKSEEKKAEKKAEKKSEEKEDIRKKLVARLVYQVYDPELQAYKVVINLWEAKQDYGDYTPVWGGFLRSTGAYSHLLTKEEKAILLPHA